MEIVLFLAGGIWAFLGFGVFATAKSAIHEILACLAVSFAVMFWGLAGIIMQLKRMRWALDPKAPEQRAASIEQTTVGGPKTLGPLSSRL